jgi:hypothetical protein
MDSASPKPSKARGLIIIVIVALILLLVIVDMRRRSAESKLQELSMQLNQTAGNQQQNKEAAQKVVSQVRKLYNIPDDVDPTVATIVDVNELRKRNAFYNKAKNGDYLIITNDRAILFDPKANVIVDVVPVQIQADASSSSKAPARARSSVPAAAVSSK